MRGFKFDARIKILLFAVLLGLVITSRGYLFHLIVLAASVSFCFAIKVPPKKLLHRLMEPLYIAGVLFLIKSLSGHDELAGFSLLGVNAAIYRDGMLEGLRLMLRILAAVSALMAFTFSTPFHEILWGLDWFRVPKQFIEITLFAQRYIKVFFGAAQTIFYSQRNRLGYSNLKRTFNSFGILAGSLTIKAFEQAQAVSTSMVQRGYEGSLPAMARDVSLSKKQVLAAGVLIVAMVLAWKI